MKRYIVLLIAVAVIALGCASAPAAQNTQAPNAAAGKSLYATGFENGTGGEWVPKGPVQLEVSTDVAHSGKASLKVSNRNDTWHAPEMDITGVTTPRGAYSISCWVFVPKASEVSAVKLTCEVLADGAKNWIQIVKPVAAEAGKWVQVVGKYSHTASVETVTVYVEPTEKAGDFYVDDIDISSIAE